MKKIGVEALESLMQRGYDLRELSIVYFNAKKKGLSKENITEEYLISNITNVKQEYELTKEEFESHVNKKMDFILQGMGIVYALSNIINGNKVLVTTRNHKMKYVDYSKLIPVFVKTQLYKDVIESKRPKYISFDFNLSREEIYEILIFVGEDEERLAKYGIVLNQFFEKEEKNEMELKINKKEKQNNEYIEKEKKQSKYISIDGSISQEQVDFIVEKIGEDLTLLEVIGIVPNQKNTQTDKINSKK